jgi:hypothetical protein
MVLTLPARGNFDIRARHKGLGCRVGFVLPVTARAGRTCEALAVRREAVHCTVTPRNEGCYLLYCQQFPSLNALYGTAMQGVKQGDNVARPVTWPVETAS